MTPRRRSVWLRGRGGEADSQGRGVALNRWMDVAVVEKLPALRPEQALGSRSARADRPRTLGTLARIGQGNLL